MSISDIIPWHGRKTPSRREELSRDPRDPFSYIQQQMNRMFDDTFALNRAGVLNEQISAYVPPVEIIDAGGELRVTVELPGIEPKDLDVNVTEDSLIIRGEKRHEHSEQQKGEQWTERTYGAFERVISLPVEVKGEECKADFKNGILHLTLPKVEGAKAHVHKVQIQ